MKVKEVLAETNWSITASEEALEKEISGVFCGDLLSWVMGNCEPGQAWITVQTHLNIVAVAALKEISCLIIVQGAEVPQATLDKVLEENIALFQVPKSAYDVCCECFKLGI